jgi:hypothetical protein
MAQKMANMTGYSNGYTPPSGSAGASAFGNYSSKKNTMGVPRKGSSINSGTAVYNNSDHQKVMSLKVAQSARESLRGQGC